MIRFFTRCFYSCLEKLRDTAMFRCQEIIERGDSLDKAAELSGADAETILDILHDLRGQCEVAELADSITLIKEAQYTLRGFQGATHLPLTATTVLTDLQRIERKVLQELGDRWFAYIPWGKKRYFENAAAFGEEIAEAFEGENISTEIKDAGNCMAAGLYTACIFHLMRIAELVLREISTELSVQTRRPLVYEDPDKILTAIVTKLGDLKQTDRGSDRDDQFNFYHGMQLDIRACMDLWRNRCDHAREIYGEDRAKEAWGHVEAMVQRYAAWKKKKKI